jgi:hypothetical protein
MYQTSTATGTRSSTYSEARARHAMDKVLDDIVGLFARGFITKQCALDWYGDLLYILSQETAEFFELQCSTPGGRLVGLRYVVTDDGRIYEDRDSGGLDYFALPDRTMVSLFVHLRRDSRNYRDVLEELGRRGWGTNGRQLDGTLTRERAYSKDGYGVTRNRVGDW